MVLWLVAVPIVILLLALAGANWKTFHLAYAKHLMRSTDPAKQKKGAWMVYENHLREGMPLEEVRAILAPAKLIESPSQPGIPEATRVFDVYAGVERPENYVTRMLFDENDRLGLLEFSDEVGMSRRK